MKKSANIVNTAAMPAAALEKAGDRGYNVYSGFSRPAAPPPPRNCLIFFINNKKTKKKLIKNCN